MCSEQDSDETKQNIFLTKKNQNTFTVFEGTSDSSSESTALLACDVKSLVFSMDFGMGHFLQRYCRFMEMKILLVQAFFRVLNEFSFFFCLFLAAAFSESECLMSNNR